MIENVTSALDNDTIVVGCLLGLLLCNIMGLVYMTLIYKRPIIRPPVASLREYIKHNTGASDEQITIKHFSTPGLSEMNIHIKIKEAD